MRTSSKSLAGMIAAAGLILSGTTSGARAQTTETPMHGQHGQMAGPMMEECKAMMTAHQQMKSEMESAQAKLDALVEEMNAAGGDAKIEAMAKVVTELASQRKSMMSRMMTMQPQMMQHMMGHMRTAVKEGSEKGMECPMMKEMGEKGPSNR